MHNPRSLILTAFAGLHFLIILPSQAQEKPQQACQSSLNGTHGSSKVGNLTMCAMIRDEIAYIVEWIEFYRLQGVDRFLLYDDGSTDDTVLLQHLYQSKGLADLVQVYPNNPYRHNNRPAEHVSGHYVQRQRYALDHCNRQSIDRTKWVIVVDVDEFVYAPSHKSIWEFLESKANETEASAIRPLEKTISQFAITGVRYGTSGILKRFLANVHVDPYNGTVKLLTNSQLPNTTSDVFPMIIQANQNRAPHDQLDADFDERYNETCKHHRDPNSCTHAIGKSIWKPERCDVAYIHWCEKLRGYSYATNIKELRLNHYAFKSREHVEGLIGLMKPFKMAAFDNFDAAWFSTRHNPMPKEIVEAVRTALKKFQA